MSFLSELIEKGKSMLGAIPQSMNAHNVVERDRFDEASWEEIKGNVSAITKLETEMSKSFDYVDDFLQDVHNSLYKGDPKNRARSDMDPTRIGNHTMIEEFQSIPEVKALRTNTRGDEYATAMGIVGMTPVLKESMAQAKKFTEELAQKQKDAEAALAAQAGNLQQMLDQLAMQPEMPPGAGPSQGEQALQQAMDQFNKQKQDVDLAAQATQDGAAQAAHGVRAEMRQAAEQAAAAGDEEAGLCAAFGVDDGELQRMSFEERATLAKNLRNNRLAGFYKLLGQFKMIQQGESRRKVENASTEIHGVKLSDDLTRLTAGEFINMATPEMEDDFWLRYSEHQLLTWDVRGKEKMGQGPVIVVCDESGSMETADVAGGTREAWSKALALALCDQARQKGRDFHYIGFSSARQQWTCSFPGGKAPIAQVLEFTEHFYAGGTHYEEPLRQALQLVEEQYEAHGKPKPDIVFLTDDEYGGLDETFMHEWNRVKDKTSLRCFGVAIGCSVGGALQAVSDNVREITELASDPRVMADVFRSV